jgi:TetR/AcrR family transcriptional repressor of mexJK operon
MIEAHRMDDLSNPVRPYKAGRPKKTDIDRRKARVLDVATGLFIANGYAGTTLEAIARAAGVGTRTLYHHYGDKDGLFRAIVRVRTEQGAVGDLSMVGAAEAGTPRAILLRAAENLLTICLSPETIALERLMVSEAKRIPDMSRSVVEANMASLRRSVAGVFEEMGRRGLIACPDVSTAAKWFIDLVVGIASVQVVLGYAGSVPTPAELEAKVEFFLRGVARQTPS